MRGPSLPRAWLDDFGGDRRNVYRVSTEQDALDTVTVTLRLSPGLCRSGFPVDASVHEGPLGNDTLGLSFRDDRLHSFTNLALVAPYPGLPRLA